MAYKYIIRFSGAGGHQLIQAARILAEAAAIYDNKNATESCSYGPEARGSSCRAEVIISDEAIDYPKADKIDFLITLTQEAYNKHIADLEAGGTAVIAQTIATGDELKDKILYKIPFTEIMDKQCGSDQMINIVALGIFARISNVVSKAAIRQAIMARIPKESEEIYLKAFEFGFAIDIKPVHY
jgi:2-oxoglutarate ferredoxin oxidoreductase subunit gamma